MKFLSSLTLSAVLASALFGGEVNVFAAANTTYAFPELIAEFNKANPKTKISVTLGASGALVTQIQNSAPADVFMAADMDFARKLDESGFSATRPVVYAQGALAMFSIRDVDFSKGLNALSNLKSISIANPNTAPYGKASIEALKNANLFDKVEKSIVYTQKISETLSQALSAADVGFIAASALYDVKMSKYKEGVNYAFVDPSLYTPIDQGIVITKRAENNDEARAFYDFVLSKNGADIFKKFGYNVPKK
ncbi:molybdate ABC transporter substrate-binding protein [Campylobacter sp. RM9344]|uniref:Molybdate ABC transporter substrate-binding protein n=1 Tax=Campylobacter californiensis TaxID=1032243 RepID=A0AAW3ZRW1_9BACT|nr:MULTISPECIES: molybdate ABC transporter substrate-binding protein [unclassified Campylobacter]MBE2984051.1 molybdate ABC transporter substrate-binding protein [Campylobacter sp. RM6883]MBE2987123.1 molybdate ABC transporter substrate-binding protein [Campylobacter sp. RM12919]MBE2988372.1 molybdate ABC transporter substrate-binding protein [Campylobacter sp. RM12920]MBE2995476.1 molybdate ABC transporter substrate-binding protein [Campylobacter sp. RM6913]MBE3021978.1 molybdate ABC transpor